MKWRTVGGRLQPVDDEQRTKPLHRSTGWCNRVPSTEYRGVANRCLVVGVVSSVDARVMHESVSPSELPGLARPGFHMALLILEE